MSELLIILLIVVLLFGTKRLKTLGGDLGGAIRGFRKVHVPLVLFLVWILKYTFL